MDNETTAPSEQERVAALLKSYASPVLEDSNGSVGTGYKRTLTPAQDRRLTRLRTKKRNGQAMTEAEVMEGVVLETIIEKSYIPGRGRTPVFHFIKSNKVKHPKAKKKSTKTNVTSLPVVNTENESDDSKTMQPSEINSLQDGNELLVSTLSTLMLTVSGQEVSLPVEVNILLRVAEVTVTVL
jgi:hypothetical protein